jgi:hypothetical protein
VVVLEQVVLLLVVEELVELHQETTTHLVVQEEFGQEIMLHMALAEMVCSVAMGMEVLQLLLILEMVVEVLTDLVDQDQVLVVLV